MAQELWCRDLFDESMDTALSSHTADTGQTWQLADFDPATEVIPTIGGGLGYIEFKADVNGTDKVFGARIVQAPVNTDYRVLTHVLFQTDGGIGLLNRRIDIVLRHGGSGLNTTSGYYIRASRNGQLQLIYKSNSNSNLLVNVNSVITLGTTHKIDTLITGNNIKVYVDDVLEIDYTDASRSFANRIGLTVTTNRTSEYIRVFDFEVYADSPDTKKIELADSFVAEGTLELNEPCEQQEPLLGKTVLDNFSGPNNQVLGDHVSDSGHNFVEGHAFASRPFSGLGLKPMILNGNGMLQTPAGTELRDTRQLAFTPRINSYEIGCCFRKSSVSKPDNWLIFYWRDTTSAPVSRSRGSRATYNIEGKRYELFLGNGGYAQLQRRIGNTVTVLDTTTGAFPTDNNNFLQIVQDGSDIIININGVPVLTATDAAITEVGTISLNVSSRRSSTNFAKGYWSLNWFYVDDSYATFPIANKELVFTERATIKENFTLEKPDYDTGHFVQIPDAAAFLDVMEPPTIEEPTTKDIGIGEGFNFTDLLAQLYRDEDCSQGSIVTEVGSFSVNTSTGNQTISHSLGVTPKFIIVFCAGKTPGSFGATAFTCQGFSDGATSACVGVTLEDNQGTSDTYKRISRDLFLMRNVSGTVVKAATLSSWNNTQFVVNHSSANADAMTVCYILVGGSGVSAKVGQFNTITTTGGSLPANQVITGVGFQPQGLMLLETGGSISGYPASANGGIMGVGMTDGTGQGVTELHDADAQAVSDCAQIQLTDAVLVGITSTGANARKANINSFDSDGFTLHYTANFAEANPVVYLAVRGLSVKVGNFNKSTGGAPASQAVSGVGFQPKSVMMVSWGKTTSASGSAGVRLGVGAFDGTHERAVAAESEDNNTTSQCNEIVKTDKVFIKCNNDTPTIEAEADGTSLDSDGFTLSWSINDAVATEIMYMAFGDLPPIPCDKKIIMLLETLLALDIPALSGDRGIELLETAHINELPGVSGNQINKILTIAEFLSAEDTPLSSMEIELSDSFEASEVISRVFEFLEFAQHGETLSLSNLLSVIDTGNINDQIAVRLILSLSDTANISETIKRLLALNETATLSDLINTMRSLPGTQDTARAADRIQITRSSVATFAQPEKTYHARELKTLFLVDRARKVN